jgi:hypothetical protein
MIVLRLNPRIGERPQIRLDFDQIFAELIRDLAHYCGRFGAKRRVLESNVKAVVIDDVCDFVDIFKQGVSGVDASGEKSAHATGRGDMGVSLASPAIDTI